eukprot:559186-Rhodomonas_salina.2
MPASCSVASWLQLATQRWRNFRMASSQVEKSSSALVESWARKWGLVNEAEPNAAWTIFPIMALSKEQDHANHLPLPSIGVSEFSTLQKARRSQLCRCVCGGKRGG